MIVPSPRARRGGLTTVAVLVCLVVILLISGVLLKIGVAQRDRVRAAERSMQAEWLAQAGLDRALFRLSASADYGGESWRLSARDLGLAEAIEGQAEKAALVLIKVEKAADAKDGRLIKVQADFPPDPPHRARRSAQMHVRLGSPKTGGSR